MLRELFPGVNKILIDANLLVVLVVGQIRPTLLHTVSPGDYPITSLDFELIISAFSEFELTVTTPYLLAEVNTLFPRSDINTLTDCRSTFSTYIPKLSPTYTEPAILARDTSFASFGIADVSIMHAADSHTLVLTADWALTGLLTDRGCWVFHYDVLRQLITSIR